MASPLYLAMSDGALIGSWDIAELSAYIPPTSFSPVAATRLLTRRQRCSSRTLFEGVYRVTERATAVIDGSAVDVEYPEPHQHVLQERRLRAEADPVAFFDRALAHVLGPVLDVHGGAVAVELSGGLDSANVAISAAGLSPFPVQSLGLVVDGEAGQEQRARRAQIVERLDLRDSVFPASGTCPSGIRRCAAQLVRTTRTAMCTSRRSTSSGSGRPSPAQWSS